MLRYFMVRKPKSSVKGPGYSSGHESGRRNDNVIFIICLIISFVFWGLIKLSEVYESSYTFKIHYNNVPVKKRLTEIVDTALNVSFNARGFTILRLDLFKDMENLTIDLNDFNILKEGDEYFIYTQKLKDQMAEMIGVPESELNLSESMLSFRLEDLYEKEVRVKANLSLNFKEQYDLYENAIISPPTVNIYGPKATIDTISVAETQNVTLQNLDNDQTITAGLSNPNPRLLRYDPKQVEIKIRVEKFTESSIEIPIDFSGIKQNIQSFPSSVKVYFKVAQKDFNNVQAGGFNVQPEISGINLQDVDRLHLVLTKKPEFVRNERIVPTYVEFLITK
jgi:YbbR-like protein